MSGQPPAPTNSDPGVDTRGLPVLPPFSALLELASVVGLILLVDWALPDVDLTDIQPNPLWLPVLLLSLQYGTVSGLMAAVVAIIVTVVAGFPEEGVGENHFTYALRIWAQPILWIGAAVLLGQLRLRQITERQELLRHATELVAQRDHLAAYASGLRQRCETLERGRAGSVDAPAVRLLGAVGGMTVAGADLGGAFKQCLSLAFPGAEASLFSLSTSGARLVADSAWPPHARWSREIAASHPLYRAVVEEGASLCVATAGDETRLNGEGLAAAPVRSPQSRRVIGFVKIESAPAAAISEATTAALEVIAAALVPALEPAEPRLLSFPAGTRVAAAAERPWRRVVWRSGATDRPPDESGAEPPLPRPRPRIAR